MATQDALFFGLTNGGATCWLNATFQALISLDPLMEVLYRAALDANPATLALAHEINTALVAKFFGFGYITRANRGNSTESREAEAQHLAELMRQIDRDTMESFTYLSSIIDSLSNPESFYESTQLKEFAATPLAKSRRLPLATCALISYSPHPGSDGNARNPDAALRLFGALVLYCALTGARPVPEYRSIGEVGPAMLETIIGAICYEYEGTSPSSTTAEAIRALFRVQTTTSCLCFDHSEAMTRALKGSPATPNTSASTATQLCIQVVPPTDASGEAFVASTNVAVDVCERNCTACPAASTAIPSIMNIERRENFGPIIAIITDDTVARGLTHPTVTSVYRRSPVGTLCVPREMTLLSRGCLVKYRLVAQVIQEGGHFTAIVSRTPIAIGRGPPPSLCHAYASDTSISLLKDAAISPGVCALFYTIDPSAKSATSAALSAQHAESIMMHATYRSMQNYTILNRNTTVVATSGMTTQPLCAAQNINYLPTFEGDDDDIWRMFYYVAINTHVALSARAGLSMKQLETLYKNKVGAKYAELIARQFLRSTTSDDDSNLLVAWHFWIEPHVLALINSDAGDKFRTEFKKRIQAAGDNPFDGLAAHPSLAAFSSADQDALKRLIEAYGARIRETASRSSRNAREPAPILTPIAASAPCPLLGRRAEPFSPKRPMTPPSPSDPRKTEAPPIFPRRVSATQAARPPQFREEFSLDDRPRPSYITPELVFAYERMKST